MRKVEENASQTTFSASPRVEESWRKMRPRLHSPLCPRHPGLRKVEEKRVPDDIFHASQKLAISLPQASHLSASSEPMGRSSLLVSRAMTCLCLKASLLADKAGRHMHIGRHRHLPRNPFLMIRPNDSGHSRPRALSGMPAYSDYLNYSSFLLI